MNTILSRYYALPILLTLVFLGQATVDAIASVYTGWVVSWSAFAVVLPLVLCEAGLGALFLAQYTQQTRQRMTLPKATPVPLRTPLLITAGVTLLETLVHLVLLGIFHMLKADEHILTVSSGTVETGTFFSVCLLISGLFVPHSFHQSDANS